MKTQKKQMIVFFLKMCIFIVVFWGIFSIIHKVFLVKSDGLYNYINFIRQPVNSIDILVLGSSHSKDGIDARELDNILLEEYGIETRTFNMSVNQMRMEQIVYRFKEALKTQKPSILIIENYSFSPDDTVSSESIDRWAIDYVPLTGNKIEYIQKNVEEGLQSSFLVPFIKYHSRWNDLSREDWEILFLRKSMHRIQDAGFVAPDKSHVEENMDDFYEQDFSKIIEEKELPEKYRKIVQEILKICEEIDCKVLFLSIPYKMQAGFGAAEMVKYNNYIVREYVDDENVYMFDLQKMVRELDWGYELMHDDGHINNQGRKVVDQQLAGMIKDIWR